MLYHLYKCVADEIVDFVSNKQGFLFVVNIMLARVGQIGTESFKSDILEEQ